jgi:hypothetical protein
MGESISDFKLEFNGSVKVEAREERLTQPVTREAVVCPASKATSQNSWLPSSCMS